MTKKFSINKNLNSTYSVKFFTGRYYKTWCNPITQKILVFESEEIATYWADLPSNYSFDWVNISGTIGYYI